MENMPAAAGCGYKNGALPGCAPLAVGLVPRQAEAVPQYEAPKALSRGTLFPGLDLPFGNIVNTGTAVTPLAELMALDFACHDLSLYLDTHPEDQEAFEAYRDLLKLAEDGQREYAEQYGPISKTDLREAERYTWIQDPWPWQAAGNTEA